MAEYSASLYARVKDYLDSEQLHYDENLEDGVFKYGISIKSKIRSINVVILVETNKISVVTTPSFGGDPDDSENMHALAEYVCRANYGLVQGSFQLDFRDGEIRYWSALLTDENSLPSREVLDRVIYVCYMMWERYGEGFLKVNLAGVSPEQAVNEAESQHN